ncbi:MAG: tetratricopeptide repeat protein [Verrucomicrobiaceae bacterium]|nr:tetratricopeptide repeat protein [Verrucomicrobiaceae bacterium]
MTKRLFTPKTPSMHTEPPAAVTAERGDPAPAFRTPWRIHLLIAAVMGGLCACLYGWTADFPFLFDDIVYMTKNKLFMEARSLPYLTDFTAFATWPGKNWEDPDLALNIIMRPAAYLSLHLNYMLDGFQPRWFRVGNMALHAANGWLLYWLVMLSGRSLVEKGLLRAQSARFIAVGASLLFLVHPLATESVTYVIQRFTSMATFFILACLVLHLHSIAVESRSKRAWWRAAAVLCALLGMQTKETAVTVPLLAVLVHWQLLGAGLRRALWSGLPLLLCLPLVPALVWKTSGAIHGGDWDLLTALNIVNYKNAPLPVLTYFITQITVVADYVRLLLWPSGQNALPDPPVYSTLWNARVLICAAALACLPGLTWLVRRSQGGEGHGRLMVVGVLWFFATISVSSSVVPLPDLMAEHRVYLPSIGIFIFIAALLDRLVEKSRIQEVMGSRLRYGFVGAAAACLAVATCQRNEIWRDEISLWGDTVAKSPGKFVAWTNLGLAQGEANMKEAALKSLNKAVECDPNLFFPRYNRALLYAYMERWRDCVDECKRIVVHPPRNENDIIVYSYLGFASTRLGRLNEGEKWMRKVLRYDPDHFFSHKVLGIIYFEKKYVSQARRCLLRANQLSPGDPLVAEVLAACP